MSMLQNLLQHIMSLHWKVSYPPIVSRHLELELDTLIIVIAQFSAILPTGNSPNYLQKFYFADFVPDTFCNTQYIEKNMIHRNTSSILTALNHWMAWRLRCWSWFMKALNGCWWQANNQRGDQDRKYQRSNFVHCHCWSGKERGEFILKSVENVLDLTLSVNQLTQAMKKSSI